MKKIIIVMIIFFCAFVFGFSTGCIQKSLFDSKDNICQFFEKKIIYSPNKLNYVEMKPYSCNSSSNIYTQFRVYYDNSFYPIDINEKDINWSDKPTKLAYYGLPKVIWTNKDQLDVYIKTKIKYGIETIYLNNIKHPITVNIHYDRQD